MTLRLDEGFFDRPVLQVAPDLLGAIVRVGGVAVRLTEVEAYAGEGDPGSHAFRGRTPRTAVMFGPPGGLYVYFTYGMHWCANLVCGPKGVASAVLLRAGEVVAGIEVARERRGGAGSASACAGLVPRRRPLADRDLARGPARLTVALGLGKQHNGIRTTDPDSPVLVEAPARPSTVPIRRGPRVGVGGAGGDPTAYPWRFWLDGEPTVSTYRPGTARRRAP
ncbi:MAG: DNA-3-methyladenine glycosylase [Dermatophilaceae bacterium]